MKPTSRRLARECAVQAIYSWQISQNNISDIEFQFLSEHAVNNCDINYFRELLHGVATNSEYLDKLMIPVLSREIRGLGQIEKAVLRISLFELSKRKDIPYKVVINEGIELAKYFGSVDSYKFINGVLNTIASIIRK
ncbi:transcription antitermination factor NusB [Candidatus Profftia sp. (ex Adelges kitamiensis)]|uniref:transcription antitermination factor NusB n=1 Tax=Candidatus Profftia sp. (ex Adelges kitamiensis) TaxID=2864218 RepID=UPI001CE2EEE2|nr:transcription antitermination factor NusB [Candidatus Profftia sp. (ex Adelges kitamiensis)]